MRLETARDVEGVSDTLDVGLSTPHISPALEPFWGTPNFDEELQKGAAASHMDSLEQSTRSEKASATGTGKVEGTSVPASAVRPLGNTRGLGGTAVAAGSAPPAAPLSDSLTPTSGTRNSFPAGSSPSSASTPPDALLDGTRHGAAPPSPSLPSHLERQRATEKLLELCTGFSPTLLEQRADLLRSYVEKGADVMAVGLGMKMPALHWFVSQGLVNCVGACLQTPFPLDFTVVDPHTMRSPLLSAFANTDDTAAVQIIILFVKRLLSTGSRVPALYTMMNNTKANKGTKQQNSLLGHPVIAADTGFSLDTVNWMQKDSSGDDLLNAAAQRGVLYPVWNALSEVPYFKNARAEGRPLTLWRQAHRWDWDLIPHYQNALVLGKGMLDDTLSLAYLCRKHKQFGQAPEGWMVEACVEAGANIFYTDRVLVQPILHTFILLGSAECVAACLCSPGWLNFTLPAHRPGMLRANALHCICMTTNGSTEELLDILLRRLENHAQDKIDWEERDGRGRSFLSCAAAHHKLSVVWPHVRRLKHFTDIKKPIPLSCTVYRSDWERLSLEDQRCFVVAQYPNLSPQRPRL